MRIAVTDDEKIFREKICGQIDRFYKSIDIVSRCFCDGCELIREYESGKRFDAIFLDIEMKKLGGMETAKKIREYSETVPIIFITSHDEFAADGYEVNAFRFLSKDYSEEKLYNVLIALREEISKRCSMILRQGTEEFVVSTEDIICAEADNVLVRFTLPEKTCSARMKLTEALELLNKELPFFIRVHRCSIVNLCHVISYTDKEIRMDNGMIIPLSRSFRDLFRQRVFDYIKKRAK